jgi:hypothetical protein
VDGCKKILKEMEAKGIVPPYSIFSSFIKLLLAKGAFYEAAAIFEEFPSRGLRPDKETCGLLIRHAIQQGDHEKCERYFSGTLLFYFIHCYLLFILYSFSFVIAMETGNIVPKYSTCVDVFTQRAKLQNLEGCLSLYKRMKWEK